MDIYQAIYMHRTLRLSLNPASNQIINGGGSTGYSQFTGRHSGEIDAVLPQMIELLFCDARIFIDRIG